MLAAVLWKRVGAKPTKQAMHEGWDTTGAQAVASEGLAVGQAQAASNAFVVASQTIPSNALQKKTMFVSRCGTVHTFF